MDYIINTLETNGSVFNEMLTGISKEEYMWREGEGKWNLLEIVCHLYDEEREDFRARLLSVLENPATPFVKIDPVAWVHERNYSEQNYSHMLNAFLAERKNSIQWLRSLENPKWTNAFQHPKVGPISGSFLLANWLAHDYLHIRQITRIRYKFLNFKSGEGLKYAGDW